MVKTEEEILNEDFFSYDLEKLKNIKFNLFKNSFTHHYNNCPNYRKLCEMNNLSPENIQTYEDLNKIVGIPSDAFRKTKNPIISVPEEEVLKVITSSSTTSPHPAQFPLDKNSLQKLTRINGELWKSVNEIDTSNLGTVFFFTPPLNESSPGLVKGGYMSFKGMGFGDEDIIFCVKDGNINAEEVIEKMKNAKKPIITFGPPFGYLPFLSVNSKSIELGEDSRIIMSGGWKGVKHDISKDELKKGLSKFFNIDLGQIRDGYGATDMMTMLPECKYHKKHVPPWNHISIRDPENLSKPLLEGEEGIIVLMASWITSYPAFCIPGDKGYVKEGVCECGRTGQTVEVTGRAEGAGKRGCAIKLEEFMETVKEDENLE